MAPGGGIRDPVGTCSSSKHSWTLHNSVTVEKIFISFFEYVLGQDDVWRTRMIVPPFLVSKLCPFDYFFSKQSCTPHN